VDGRLGRVTVVVRRPSRLCVRVILHSAARGQQLFYALGRVPEQHDVLQRNTELPRHKFCQRRRAGRARHACASTTPRTSIWPVTAAEIKALRRSLSKSIACEARTARASILVTCTSK